MRDFRELSINKPVLILGKGPSLSTFRLFDLDPYFKIGLNEVENYAPVDISMIIHGEMLDLIKGPVILPFYPHIGKTPGPLSTRQNGYHYNLNTAPPVGDAPIIYQDGFTIHALLNILGFLGVKTIRTLGVDSAETGYSSLVTKTKLSEVKTKREFWRQKAEIERQIKKYNFDYSPLAESNDFIFQKAS